MECSHPSFKENKCRRCNLHIADCGNPATIPFRYIDDNLSITVDEVKRVRDVNMKLLTENKKLHLVLDLDHTLIHSMKIKKLKSTDKETIKNIKYDDVFEIKLSNSEYVLKLRPGAREFLDMVSSMFELSIFTIGKREYAHQVVEQLGGLSRFSCVIAREDCLKTRQKTLDLVLSHKQTVLIVDDTEQVWEKSCKENLITIKRYDFFPIKEEGIVVEMDKELDRVFEMLREVHSLFYDGNNEDYGMKKDAREVLKRVLIGRGLSCLSQEQHQEEDQKKLGDCIEKGVEVCRVKRLKIKFNGSDSFACYLILAALLSSTD
ncbi:RNA polymerase II C-terminal domain phosphatase-like 4 [Spinacia oleracea]|uniref:protein-serine/threonine phosphatase n=1 Tax=Spinacia oleracea TaxID=3562 RepID=A0ABM3QLY6_SPIOL|nr:RNA polymerase II C-terminal domain phosphatase-like 4 [Spinacia oleracea]